MKIIDYASAGFCGSQHDSQCFNYTSLTIHQRDLIALDKWTWADLGYK